MQTIKQDRGKNFTTFRHFLYSKKKCLGLLVNVTFNQGTKTRFGALKGLVGRGGGRGEGIWKFVRTSGKILATPLLLINFTLIYCV